MSPRALFLSIILGSMALQPAAPSLDRDRGNAPYQVDVELEFEIQVPNIIFFQIGSENDTVDTVTFDLSGVLPEQENVELEGDNEFIPTATVNAAENGTIPIRLRANVGQVSITATVSGGGNGLVNENSQFLSFELITTLSSDPAFPPPMLTNQGGNTVVISGNSYAGLVTDRAVNWTYQYSNPELPAAGTYIGTVTYTASIF